jgi:hypothetical protein
MRRFRFHIGTFVILVLILGVGFAALRESTDTWDSIIFSLVLGVLLISILLAIHRTGQRRAFWLGFALFGAAYLGFSLVPSIEPRLITTKALAFLDSKVPDRTVLIIPQALNDVASNQKEHTIVAPFQGYVVQTRNQDGSRSSYVRFFGGGSGSTENFMRIGHSVLALIAAFVGGLISRHLHARNQERTSELSSPAEHRSGPSQ